MTNNMKKTILILLLISSITLNACTPQTASLSKPHSTEIQKHKIKLKKQPVKINIHHKFKGFKLANVPKQFCGTWYRADPYSKKARKLIITSHTVNGDIAYQKIDPDLKLNHNSVKQNKKYAGNICLISVQGNSLKVRGFLDVVDLVYKTGFFKEHSCLFMSYGTNPQAINGGRL